MTVTVVHTIDQGTRDFLASLFTPPTAALDAMSARLTKVEQTMSVLSDKIDAANTAADSAIARVQAEVKTLTDQIAALTPLVATADDQAKLDALQAKLNALDPASPVVLPPVDPNAPPAGS